MHKDYLGTILAITDEKGELVEERHFDAWGNLTHGSMQVLDRGYTSHEHLQDVGLIHMNGRLYDLMLRRFLNADEHIQDPTNTQCYNKYGYVMNNPLMFSDPDGEYAVGVAIAVAALVAVLSYTVTIYARDGSLRHWKLGDAYVSAIYGAFSGAVTFGVGSIFSAAGGTATALAESIKGVAGGAGLAVVQAGAHAVTQGVLSSVQGGNFWSAALSGAFGSLGASAFGAIGGDFAKSTVGTITFGAISGGVGAELSGGNFWQGVVIGGMVSGLNHVLHQMDGDGDPPSKYKKWFSARMKEASALLDDIGDWGVNVGTAAGMTLDWATGSGASSTIFVGGRVANAMSNANRVNQARAFYYNKYKGVGNLKGTSVEGFKGSFGLSGLMHAGLDSIEQFVGTYRINIYNLNGKSLWFVLTNQTSMNSFLYDLGPSYNRSTFGPGGNTNQTYIWNEPVRR